MNRRVWVDIVNPSDVYFFYSIIKEMQSNNYDVTLRNRAETKQLAEQFKLYGNTIGKDSPEKIMKLLNLFNRFVKLSITQINCDFSFSFENSIAIALSRMKGIKSISFCDNDLKFKIKKSFSQSIDNKMRSLAWKTYVPSVCLNEYEKSNKKGNYVGYDGLKEYIYLPNVPINNNFKSEFNLPNEYIVIRPEAKGSFYINKEKSIVNDLIKKFSKNNYKIILLPRDEPIVVNDSNVVVPKSALNGINLIYHSRGVLTGSGTMAREAACLNKKAISFFPSDQLLSVDSYLIEQQRMIHSRDIDEIYNYIDNGKNKLYDNTELMQGTLNDLVIKLQDDISI